jgi:hypothetical protein
VLLCAIGAACGGAGQYGNGVRLGEGRSGGLTIPGATVTLISASKGTTLGTTITNERGVFTFPHSPADTSTLPVEMPSFKTLKHSGLFVRAGSRVAVGTLTIDVGGATETVQVKAESQSFRRRAASVLSSSDRPHTTTSRS